MMTHEPSYFTEFKKELFKMLKYRFNGIEEQVGDLSKRVSGIESKIEEIVEDNKRSKKRSDQHSDAIMIGMKLLDNHNTRIAKLEKELA